MAENKMEKQLYESLNQSQQSLDDFAFAPYSEKEAERTGFSYYSYWGSTIRVFLKIGWHRLANFACIAGTVYYYTAPLT